MNFQDLFARYREMGAMAPQQTFEEQLFVHSQNAPPNSWALSGDPVNKDLPSPPENNNNERPKKERLMFKLPSPDTFRPFLMSMDEEHKQGLSGDEEVEELLQPQPQLQQGWNLGLLKTNSLSKDYYKLTSNMLHTLIMGIKELTDGEISSAWQIAQDRGCHKRSNFSNIFLQDVGKKPMVASESNHSTCIEEGSMEGKRNREPPTELESNGRPRWKLPPNDSGGQAAAPKESVERSKDIDGILELRKLLWRQIVPHTCLGSALEPKQDGEKTMKLMQESRMKVVNAVGFGMSSDNHSSTFPETCHVSFKAVPQQAAAKESEREVHTSPDTRRLKDEPRASTPGTTSRNVDGMESKFGKEDRAEEEPHGTSRSHKEEPVQEPIKTEYSVSFPEEDVDMQLEEEYANSREVKDTQPLKRSKFSENRGTEFEQAKSSTSNFHAKETRFSVDGQILPIFDGDFEIIGGEKENPSKYPDENLVSCRRGGDGSPQSHLVDRQLRVVNGTTKEVRQRDGIKYKDTVIPPECTTRSWCIVGGFSSRSQIALRNKHSLSSKPSKRLLV